MSIAMYPEKVYPGFDMDALIRQCLQEDMGSEGDITTLATVGEGVHATAELISKECGVIAGIGVAERVFDIVDKHVKRNWNLTDGSKVRQGDIIGTMEGPARSVLAAERLMLNFMQRMSGVATLTSKMADKLSGTKARLLDTRKTVPGLRVLDKWAVQLGGGECHRMGLYDMMLIKDNHIAASGGIADALQGADQFQNQRNLTIPIEIEVESLKQVEEVLLYFKENRQSKLQRVMLDNMVRRVAGSNDYDTTLLEQGVDRIAGVLETEASGNINIESIEQVGKTGVSHISSGALTHSVKALDISLKIKTHT